MNKIVQALYVMTLVAVSSLIFVGHARMQLGSGVYVIDYICDTLIPLSSIFGLLYFKNKDNRSFILNMLVLLLFIIESILYYVCTIYIGVLFAATDFLVIYLYMYILLGGKLEDRSIYR